MFRGDYWDHLSAAWAGADWGWLTPLLAVLVILLCVCAVAGGFLLMSHRGGWWWPVIGLAAGLAIVVFGVPFVNWYAEVWGMAIT